MQAHVNGDAKLERHTTWYRGNRVKDVVDGDNSVAFYTDKIQSIRYLTTANRKKKRDLTFFYSTMSATVSPHIRRRRPCGLHRVFLLHTHVARARER